MLAICIILCLQLHYLGVKNKQKLSDETVRSVVRLGEILRGIHHRLLLEGKIKVVKGKTIFLNEKP